MRPDLTFSRCVEILVPKGHCENSPAFQRRVNAGKLFSPAGTVGMEEVDFSVSGVPSGLVSHFMAYPALKRRAISMRPFGTNTFVFNFRTTLPRTR